jgi:hypothetical protein
MKENQKIMASKESGSRKLKKNILPKFEADVYSKIPPGDLIVFSVHYLIEQKVKITLEDIVSICFQLFPLKFGLKKFQKWPDSALVSRRWSDVRRKKYITANADGEYGLTSKGSNLIRKVEKALGISVPKPVIKVEPAQLKKLAGASVRKTQSSASKEKTTEPVKKIERVKTLTSKAPAVIQKKIAQLFQVEKVTPRAPAQKARAIHAKKTSPKPAIVKQAQLPEIKTPPAAQAKKAQPAQKEKVTLPAPIKKIRPIRAKKVSPASALMKQAQTVQPVQGKKAIPPAPTKKTRPVSTKKVTSVPVKQVQIPEKKIQPAPLVKKAQPAQKEKTPAPVKKTRPIHAKKISSTPVKPVQPHKAKILPVTLVEKTKPVQEVRVIPPVPVKKMRPAQVEKATPPPASANQTQAPKIKVRPDAQAKRAKAVQKVTPPAPVKKTQPVRAKKASPAPVKLAQTSEIKTRPEIQVKKKQALPVSKTVEKAQPKIAKPKTVKKTKPVVSLIVQHGKVEKSQPQKADTIAPTVTREEKERAGKFTRMMERSDVYINYKKHGPNSKINEFDFRSLLLCTMESSAETLARNVKLFKGYAEIHNRQDLTTLLIFCEDKFSYLLKPQNKSRRKAKK